VSQPLTNFDLMWTAYPNPSGSAAATKSLIGGRANASWITNTCVIRISRCFNYAGHPLPPKYRGMKTVVGGDGMYYAFRIREFRAYLAGIYGEPTLRHEYGQAGGPVPDAFYRRQGMIAFSVSGWTDATGHLDLWDGAACRHKAYFHKADVVELWEAPNVDRGASRVAQGLPALAIRGAVGEGGANRVDDVVRVQALLVESGHPVRIDGVCSAETVAAIRAFQTKRGGTVDGRVDPSGGTLRGLNGR
jgi:hypothetical protein